MMFIYAWVCLSALLLWYLLHVNHGMTKPPPEAVGLVSKLWTADEIRKAYAKAQKSPTDVKKYLPPMQGRRYVIIGGSGLVGGWIVRHLLLRGEDPEAIRILDIRSPTGLSNFSETLKFIKTDVTDPSSILAAFKRPWPNSKVEQLPLTVFLTVAYINPADRKSDFLDRYLAVNVRGTENVIAACKAAGATCLIATSSGSVGTTPPSYFLSPLARWPRGIFQILAKADREELKRPLSSFGCCYAFSKAKAEQLVLSADDPSNSFRTGCLRPGHAIYGDGVENVSSVSWSYLSKGGSPSWLWDTVTNFVSAQNVSIAHLAYEARLVTSQSAALKLKDIGGNCYYVTDPGPPRYYGDLYTLLGVLAHPSTPNKFPAVPGVPVLLLAYFIESYTLLRHRYLKALPPITGDIALITPAMFNVSTLHTVYDNRLATEEIGYQPPIQTLEGLCLQLLEWNTKAEANGKL